MSFLDRIALCRSWDPAAYRPFVIDGRALGRVGHDLARRLSDFPRVFQVGETAVVLNPALADFESRGRAVEDVLRPLSEAGEVGRWRGEAYPVLRRWGEPPLMVLDRGAVPTFGVRGFGVHLNGLVEGPEGLRVWVARRSLDKPTAPGKLDHIVAGGQPHGLGIRENLAKECAEEADIPAELAARAVAVGAVSYRCGRSEGLRDDVLFCFDLDLPPDFLPNNTDGEVESFSLWPIERVIETVRESDDFKFNVNLVILHLLIRRGLIGPDEPHYQEILEGLWLAE
ncbi:MAG: DUF4743 domain-containing protein [Rhodospirillales bacterium]|nr:DUF4743 domain-containing protein [Rhodospirillales bacterium]